MDIELLAYIIKTLIQPYKQTIKHYMNVIDDIIIKKRDRYIYIVVKMKEEAPIDKYKKALEIIVKGITGVE